MRKALVVLSGGQDSTTCLFWAKENFDEVHAVTFNYGQRHSREIDAALIVGEIAGIASHEIVDIPHILDGRSPLTNPNESLEQYESYELMDEIIGNRVELTFVPMRNALFAVLAANRAICQDIYNVVLGVCQSDNANYPDCRRLFIDSMTDTINLALGTEDITGPDGYMNLHTPLMYMTKAQSIQLATELPGCYYALGYSHTAYDGTFPPSGKDHATVLRAQGFLEALLPDPLIMRAIEENLLDTFPASKNYSGFCIKRYLELTNGGYVNSTSSENPAKEGS